MSASPTSTDVSDVLRSCLAEMSPGSVQPDLITEDTNLFDIGVDSMNMTELVLRIEQRFSLLLMPEELSADLFTRFGRLVEFVRSKLNHA